MTGRPTTWLSNVLVLPGFEGPDRTKFDSDAKFAATKETISLRGRHLEGAVFVDANLRKVDLTGAFLQDANFTRADLREARLGCLDPDTPEIKPTAGCAQLQGATLDRALLQGARLIGARLQGVSLDGADLRGALLDWAMLQGAYISNASFDGASLVSASLDAADFGFAQYDLTPPPTFRGAFLENAKLEGVDIGLASFHGASFEGTSLLGSMLTESCVWHATTPVDSKNGARILVQHTAVLSRSGAHFCDWKSKEFDEILAGIKLVVPAGERRNTLIKRFEGRLNPNNRLEGEDKIAKAWKALAASPPDDEAFAMARSAIWRAAGCEADGAPFVVRRILEQFENRDYPQWQRTLAGVFLGSEQCDATAKLTDNDKDRLMHIRDSSTPPKGPASPSR